MKIRKHRWPCALFLCISLIFAMNVIPYLINGKAFILGWDMRTIYSSNFENLRTMLNAWRTEGTLPFWSWCSFLGNDFYASKLFYFNDFWEYFFAFTSMPYIHAIIWMTYLRFLTAGFSFYAYARYNRYSHQTSFMAALLFAFSAYLLQIMRDPFFASYITFLPLYFLSVDRYIIKRKHGLFIWMVIFMIFNSYYLFYMTSLFTIVYFIWRWYLQYHHAKGMWKAAGRLIIYDLIAIACTGIIFLPQVYNVLHNARIGQRSMVFYYPSPIPYLAYISGLFTPVSMVAYRGTPIADLYLWHTPNQQIMANYVWVGSVSALLFPQCFRKNMEPWRRRIHYGIFLFAALVSLIPLFSSMMHGFSEPSFRWTANLSFLLIAMILADLDQPDRIDYHRLRITIPIVLLIQLCTPLLASVLIKTSIVSILSDYRLLLIDALFTIAIGYALMKNKRRSVQLLTIGELCFVSFFTFFGNPTQSSLSKEDAVRMTNILGAKDEFNNWTRSLAPENETSFYRIYVDPVSVYWNLGTNYNMDENIRGLMIYDSTYLASTNDLIRLDPDHVIDYLPWTFNIQSPDIMTLVSTKYAVLSPQQPSPFTHSHIVGTYADVWAVYENEDYQNLGHTYTKLMTSDDYTIKDITHINDTVIAHPADAKNIRSLLGNEEVHFTSAVTKGNALYASITTHEKGFAVLSVPFDQGWHAQINGKTVRTFEVNGGMTGIALEKGDNAVALHFYPTGLKQGKMLSLAGMITLLLMTLWEHKKVHEAETSHMSSAAS